MERVAGLEKSARVRRIPPRQNRRVQGRTTARKPVAGPDRRPCKTPSARLSGGPMDCYDVGCFGSSGADSFRGPDDAPASVREIRSRPDR